MRGIAVLATAMALAAGAVAHAARVQGPRTGGWDILDTASEPQPRPWRYDATLYSEMPISRQFPDERVVLEVSCDASGASVRISWPKDVTSIPSNIPVMAVYWALDGQTPRVTQFQVGADEADDPDLYLTNQAAFAWFDALKGGRSLQIEVGDAPVRRKVGFRLTGIDVVARAFKPRSCPAN